jgi:hypothetical protein
MPTKREQLNATVDTIKSLEKKIDDLIKMVEVLIEKQNSKSTKKND